MPRKKKTTVEKRSTVKTQNKTGKKKTGREETVLDDGYPHEFFLGRYEATRKLVAKYGLDGVKQALEQYELTPDEEKKGGRPRKPVIYPRRSSGGAQSLQGACQ